MPSVKAYARSVGVPPSTIFDAIEHGHIRATPRGGIADPKQAADWLARYEARAERIRAGGATRQRALDAQALTAAAEISALRRQLAALRRSTAPRAAAEAAWQRRVARLAAALTALPDLYAAEAAAALGCPPAAARAVLAAFSARVLADLRLPLTAPVAAPPARPSGGRTAFQRGGD